MNCWQHAYAELIESERRGGRLPGVAVAVVERDRPAWVQGFGSLAQGDATPIDGETVFALASCSKPFASASVAKLVEEGLLEWDAPVRRWMPELRLDDEFVSREVTVRDLLCNRVGLSGSENRFRAIAANRRDFIARIGNNPRLHGFRAGYAYQTDMFTLVGELVSRVSGQDWADYVRSRFWTPLSMHRTGADHRQAQANGNWARPHQGVSGVPVPIAWAYEDHVATPAGGVNASAADMARWLAFWNDRGRGLLSEDSIAELVRPHTVIRGPYAEAEFSCAVGNGPGAIRFESYALGWYVHDDAGDTVVLHTGAIAGFRSVAGLLWDRGCGLAVLSNSDAGYLVRGLFQAGLDLARGRDPAPRLAAFRRLQAEHDAQQDAQRERTQLPVEEAEAFVGDYTDAGSWRRFNVRASGDGGLVGESGGRAFLLQRVGDNRFRGALDQGFPNPAWFGLEFVRDDAGVRGLRMDDGIAFNKMETQP